MVNYLTLLDMALIQFQAVYCLMMARHVFDRPERNPKLVVAGIVSGLFLCSFLYPLGLDK